MAASTVRHGGGRSTTRPNMNTCAAGISSIEIISTRFVRPVGFSNGTAEFELKKPPPSMARCLIASCEATGPRAIVCDAPWRVVAVACPESVCGTPCQTRMAASTIDNGQEDVDQRAVEVNPEVPEVRCASDARSRERRPRVRPSRLRRTRTCCSAMPAICKRHDSVGLASVELPARVRDQARGGVHRQVRRHRLHPVRVERQVSLDPQEHVEQSCTEGQLKTSTTVA